MLEETPNRRVSHRRIPQTPWWLISCRPQATSTWDPFTVVHCEATPARSRFWTGKVCVKPSGWDWQHSRSRTFWWRNESPCWSFRWPVSADTAWQCDLRECMTPITAGPISGVYWISTDKDLLPCPLVGWEEEAVRNLQEWALGPGSRESSFSAKLYFTTALFLPGGGYRAACNEVNPTTLLPHSLASQGHQV